MQKITSLENLPIKLDKKAIDSFDKIVVLASMLDEYKIESIFKDDWVTKEFDKVKYIEYVFIKKDKEKYRVSLFFDNKNGNLKNCILDGPEIYLSSSDFYDINCILERKFTSS